ncbi:unnamed protein product [Cuscuta europaea]|uniref:Uncharacterized protein n=1 Tax=Cuscuta europaea TaxID=41803 RepID=A0A9P0ZBF0_CUSEU|nr:unnamed protein product [Cuscuta europaea]
MKTATAVVQFNRRRLQQISSFFSQCS